MYVNTNSADPDQLASRSEATLFAKAGHVCPTGDQEVAGLNPAGSATFICGD